MANENINPIIENSSGGDSDNNKKYVSILTDNSTEGSQDYYIKDLEAQIKLENKLEKPENITVEELSNKIKNASLEVGRDYVVSYGDNSVVVNALSSKTISETAKLITENKEYDIKYCIVTEDSAEERFSGYFDIENDFKNTNVIGIIYWMRDPVTGNEAPWDWVTTSSTSPFTSNSRNIIIKPYINKDDNKYTKPTISSEIDGCNKIIDLNSILYNSNGRIDIGDESTTTHIGLHVSKNGIYNNGSYNGGRVSIYLPEGALFNFGYDKNKQKYFEVSNLDKIDFSSSNFTINSNISFSGGNDKTFSCFIPTNFTNGIVGSGGYIHLYNNKSNKSLVFKVDNEGNTTITGATTLGNSLTVSGQTILNDKLNVNEHIIVGKSGKNVPNVIAFRNVENSGNGLCIGQGTNNTLSICQYDTNSNTLKTHLTTNYHLKIDSSSIVFNKDFKIVTNGSGTSTVNDVFTVNHLNGSTNIFGDFEIKNNSRGEFVKVETTGQISLSIPKTIDDNTQMRQKRFTVYTAGYPIFNAGYMNDLPQIWTSPNCENINLYSKGIIVLGVQDTKNININGEKLTINSNDVTINSNTIDVAGAITTENNISFSGGNDKTFSCFIPTNFTNGIVGSGGYIHLYNNNKSNKSLVFKVDNEGNTTITGGLTLNSNSHNLGIEGTESIDLYVRTGELRIVNQEQTFTNSSGNNNTACAIACYSILTDKQPVRYLTLGYDFSYKYYKLSISGRILAESGFYETSDGRFKTNLSPIKVNLDSLSKLQKVHFDWKDKEKMGSSRQLGMIAQEVQELYPELISTSEDGTLSLAYDKLGVIALEAIDILHKENKELKSELQDMRNRLDRLESLICGGK